MPGFLQSGGPRNAAKSFAQQGRMGDTVGAHVSPGEMVLPQKVMQQPGIPELLQQAFAQQKMNPQEFMVGDFKNKINPATGSPEFNTGGIDIGAADYYGGAVSGGGDVNNPGGEFDAGVNAGVQIAQLDTRPGPPPALAGDSGYRAPPPTIEQIGNASNDPRAQRDGAPEIGGGFDYEAYAKASAPAHEQLSEAVRGQNFDDTMMGPITKWWKNSTAGKALGGVMALSKKYDGKAVPSGIYFDEKGRQVTAGFDVNGNYVGGEGGNFGGELDVPNQYDPSGGGVGDTSPKPKTADDLLEEIGKRRARRARKQIDLSGIDPLYWSRQQGGEVRHFTPFEDIEV